MASNTNTNTNISSEMPKYFDISHNGYAWWQIHDIKEGLPCTCASQRVRAFSSLLLTRNPSPNLTIPPQTVTPGCKACAALKVRVVRLDVLLRHRRSLKELKVQFERLPEDWTIRVALYPGGNPEDLSCARDWARKAGDFGTTSIACIVWPLVNAAVDCAPDCSWAERCKWVEWITAVRREQAEFEREGTKIGEVPWSQRNLFSFVPDLPRRSPAGPPAFIDMPVSNDRQQRVRREAIQYLVAATAWRDEQGTEFPLPFWRSGVPTS